MSFRQSSGSSDKLGQEVSAVYWEEVLAKLNLGLNRGIARQVSYVGTPNNLVGMEEEQLRGQEGQPSRVLYGLRVKKGGRRVFLKGEGPESTPEDGCNE